MERLSKTTTEAKLTGALSVPPEHKSNVALLVCQPFRAERWERLVSR
jgi:hypothetical protein